MTFDQPSYRTGEEIEEARANLVFSNPSSFDITIPIMITDITAVGVINSTECAALSHGNDYAMMGLRNITFSTMVIESSITIPVCNDIVLEDNETFHLMIVSDSLHANVTSGNPNQVMVTIVDNDRKLKQTYACGCYIIVKSF